MKGWMRLWLALWLLFPAGAFADGGFIPATAYPAAVQIPDQRALIQFADGRETLVIDTSFRGQGTNFAWLVPVPSVPEVEPASPGLFTTLQFLFRPKVVHEVRQTYWVYVGLALFLAFVVWWARRGGAAIELIVLFIFGCGLLSLLSPSLGRSASAEMASAGVSVLDRKRAGFYETVTLTSKDGRAVFDWLKENQFTVPTNFVPVIQNYAAEGWCFVASRVASDALLPAGGEAQPLALTFETPRPVYPLRLTGIDNPSCRIELYVFGPGRASAPYFEVERCGESYLADEHSGFAPRSGDVAIAHPALRKLVGGKPVATKLVGKLSRRHMREDGWIEWSPLVEARKTFYSPSGAARIAANVTVPFLMFGWLLFVMRRTVPADLRIRPTTASRISATLMILAAAGWVAIYLSLPKIPVIASRSPAGQMMYLQEFEIPHRLLADWSVRTGGHPAAAPDIAWLRQTLADPMFHARFNLQTNLFTGLPWREEDSPGNYTLTQTADGVEYKWYDRDGTESVILLTDR
jgi:hypothetical protein